ncbi:MULTISPECIES: zinc-dependent MarR family transcriptional regulator [unclassified Streptococcus]|uniref:MarR family transcriptional regulator n=1 Tax=Streptococcus suis TaxID=1307 RepID=A0A426TDJ8_STRSU|nr:MarR family transcriptional regulator [Streptococcus suis]NQP19279.1 MarR family transcriptional regulator [Streptococcus suis]RRR52466.1 MarR family transcriptional regulator [Streptococcus suis]
MNPIALEIEKCLHEIVLSSENQLEILVGNCQSSVKLTNTQEHILMLIEKNAYTNTEIAKQLNISQAAVTKATKSLVAQGLLEAVRDSKDGRVVRFSLTDLARPIAAEHAHHHVHTLEAYEDLLKGYTTDEQELIGRFMQDLVEKIKK